MGIYAVTLCRVQCTGCGALLRVAGTSTFANEDEARRAIAYKGWTIHPDGRTYCPKGRHA